MFWQFFHITIGFLCFSLFSPAQSVRFTTYTSVYAFDHVAASDSWKLFVSFIAHLKQMNFSVIFNARHPCLLEWLTDVSRIHHQQPKPRDKLKDKKQAVFKKFRDRLDTENKYFQHKSPHREMVKYQGVLINKSNAHYHRSTEKEFNIKYPVRNCRCNHGIAGRAGENAQYPGDSTVAKLNQSN